MVSSIYGSSQAVSLFQAQRQAAFNKVDTDASGALSLDEFKAAAGTDAQSSDIESLFKSIDGNSDGQVSSDELDAAAKKAFEARFSQNGTGATLVHGQDFAQQLLSKADSNGNGTLSVDEFSAAKPKDAPVNGPSSEDIFAQLDSDGNGELTSTELSALDKGGPGGAGGPPPGGPPPGGGHGGNVSSNSDDDYDSALDTNGDGVVSAKERAAANSGSSETNAVDALLKLFDNDQDGSVSSNELTSGIDNLKQQMMSYLLGAQEAA